MSAPLSAPVSAPGAGGLSIREFARRDGCDDALVRRALKQGKLHARLDGSLDPALVGTGWRRGNRHPPPGADTPADRGADTPADSADTPPAVSAPALPESAPPSVESTPPAPAVERRIELQPHGGGLVRRKAPPPAGGEPEEIDLDAFSRDVLAGNVPDLAQSEKVKAAAAALRGLVAARQAADAVVELEVAEAVLFDTHRAARDAWLNWPARVAPHLAVELGVEADRVLEALTPHVQQQLEDLGDPEPDFTPPDDEG